MGSILSAIADEDKREYQQSETYRRKESNKLTYGVLMDRLKSLPVGSLTLSQLNYIQEKAVFRQYASCDTVEEEFYTDDRINKLRNILRSLIGGD